MKVENTTEHDITINSKTADGAVTSVNVPGARGLGTAKVNGSAEVDDKIVAELRNKDAVVKAWFEAGDLIVGGNKRVSVHEDDKKAPGVK